MEAAQQQQKADAVGTLRFTLSGPAQIKAFRTAIQSLAKIGAAAGRGAVLVLLKRSRARALRLAPPTTHPHTGAELLVEGIPERVRAFF